MLKSVDRQHGVARENISRTNNERSPLMLYFERYMTGGKVIFNNLVKQAIYAVMNMFAGRTGIDNVLKT